MRRNPAEHSLRGVKRVRCRLLGFRNKRGWPRPLKGSTGELSGDLHDAPSRIRSVADNACRRPGRTHAGAVCRHAPGEYALLVPIQWRPPTNSALRSLRNRPWRSHIGRRRLGARYSGRLFCVCRGSVSHRLPYHRESGRRAVRRVRCTFDPAMSPEDRPSSRMIRLHRQATRHRSSPPVPHMR